MSQADQTELFSHILQRINPRWKLLRARPLAGGVSATVTALEVQRPEGPHKLVLRCYGPADVARNPAIAAHELRLLHLLHTAGLPVPRPYLALPAGHPFDTPCLALEYIEGRSELTPPDPEAFVVRCADLLAAVHSLDCTGPDWAFLPDQAAAAAAELAASDSSPDEKRIRAALQAVWPLPQHNPPALLHGDFWPGNLLWHEGRLAALIDWEDAARGSPLADLANARLEFLWALGPAAMQRLTEFYHAARPHTDLSSLPYHDLYAALRHLARLAGWGLDPQQEQDMRQKLAGFISQAFAALPPR